MKVMTRDGKPNLPLDKWLLVPRRLGTDWMKKVERGCQNGLCKGYQELNKEGGGWRLRKIEPDSTAVGELGP